MAVSAHTNAVGFKYQRDFRYDEFITESGRVEVTPHEITTDISRKSETVRTKRTLGWRPPTEYARHVRRATLDVPYVFSQPVFDGDRFIGMATHKRFISPRVNHLSDSMTPEFEASLQNGLNQTITQSRLNLKTHRIQLGADLAEARKSLSMVADLTSQLARGVIAAKRGHWDSIPGLLGMRKQDVISGKSFANRWLEYQYGWRPLMGSIHDGIQQLRHPLSRHLLLFGKSTQRRTLESSTQDGAFTVTHKEEGSAHTFLAARMSDPYVSQIDRAGLINPVSIAWELVPFSFVVDWFVPVGNVLESLTATAGLEFHAGYIRMRRQAHRSYSRRPEPFLVEPGKYEEDIFLFDRLLLGTFPLPRLYANENPFSLSRAGNALALIRQLFR